MTTRPATPAKADVLAQARAIVVVARTILGSDFEALRQDPCAFLDRWDGVVFQAVADVPPTADEKGCSVAGGYIEDHDTGIHVVQVALAASPGRRAFTALHELGHHLQRTDLALMTSVWKHPAGDLFEELACDAFAAEMLLPDKEVDQFVDAKGPSADDIVRLYRSSSGSSRSAVCVKAAHRLPAPGHVVVLTDEGEVFFSSSRDLPRLRRGSDQSGDPVLGRGLTHGRSRGRGRFTYRDGIRGNELFIQTATFDGDLLLVVAVTDSAPWEGFALPSKDVGPQASSYECADLACGATYTSFDARCPRCSVPPCTDCGRCACPTTASQRLCPSCFLEQPAVSFIGDTCADCS